METGVSEKGNQPLEKRAAKRRKRQRETETQRGRQRSRERERKGELSGGQGPPLKRNEANMHGVFIVASAEDVPCQDVKSRSEQCLNTNTPSFTTITCSQRT